MSWCVAMVAMGALLAGCAQYNAAYHGLERVSAAVTIPGTVSPAGTPVYSADECIGAIVNGECHGTILPKTSVHPVCHGQMINGQCTGPMF